MKNVFEHIEHIKGRPHHVRKRIAFGAALSGTAVVALVWLVGSISLGAFALKGSSFADSAGEGSVIATSPANSGIAGAGAALSNENAPAHIEIVDTASSTLGQKKAEQTIIPF